MYRDIKHIFFDLDDTLWDFKKNSGVVLKQLFNEHCLNEKLNTSFETFYFAYEEVTSLFWTQYYKGEIDKQFLRSNRFHETFKKFSYNNYSENLIITAQYTERTPRGIHLNEGCLEILNYLKTRYSLHIITNGFKDIQSIKLNGSGLTNYFTQVVISDEYGMNKPDEKIFCLAEKLAGCTKEECVMIGDNFENDVKGALGAGWKAIWFTKETSEENFHRIQKLIQLKEFF
jgi:putative hydrolase of the HAD superfamily